MPDPADHLETVGDLAARLQTLDLTPILVGGMALVVLGSRRVTRDFDFLMPAPGDHLHDRRHQRHGHPGRGQQVLPGGAARHVDRGLVREGQGGSGAANRGLGVPAAGPGGVPVNGKGG